MKKIIPVIVALVLILIIGGVAVGSVLYDKYSYSKEEADWDEFYQVSGEESAIILQDEMVEEKVIIRDGICYLDLATVHKYLNETFYVDMNEQLLLYTTATETISAGFGSKTYSGSEGSKETDYTICYVENDTLYVALEYVRQFTNYSFEIFDRHVQIYTEWGNRQIAEISKDTAVRLKGGIKSPILKEVSKGDTVEILEQMET